MVLSLTSIDDVRVRTPMAPTRTSVRRGFQLALLVTSLAAVVASSGAGAASKSSVPAPVSLAGTTIVKGSAITSVPVVLPRNATLATPFGPSPSVSVAGHGRLVGIVLRGTSTRTDGVNLFAGRVLDVPGAPASAIPVGDYRLGSGGTYHFVKTSKDVTILPAGAYQLYLITEGKPVSVTLRLGGLSGVRTIAPKRPQAGLVTTPKSQVLPAAGGSGNLALAKSETTLAARGLALQAIRFRTNAYLGGQYLFCHRNGPDDLPTDSYGPTCLRRDSTVANDRYPQPEPDTQLFLNAWAGVPAGQQSIGFTYLTEAAITDVSSVALWLTF